MVAEGEGNFRGTLRILAPPLYDANEIQMEQVSSCDKSLFILFCAVVLCVYLKENEDRSLAIMTTLFNKK